jgi:hypothetical protein
MLQTLKLGYHRTYPAGAAPTFVVFMIDTRLSGHGHRSTKFLSLSSRLLPRIRGCLLSLMHLTNVRYPRAADRDPY